MKEKIEKQVTLRGGTSKTWRVKEGSKEGNMVDVLSILEWI
jgi:hypothetical protein